MNIGKEIVFMNLLDELIKEVHANAREKGFYDNPETDAGMIALIHSELSEALETLRREPKISDKDGRERITETEEELADVVIRIFDFCGHKGYKLPEAILMKMNYNKSRLKMHGKSF